MRGFIFLVLLKIDDLVCSEKSNNYLSARITVGIVQMEMPKLITLSILLLFLGGCSRPVSQPMISVESTAGQGIVMVQATGKGNDSKTREDQAKVFILEEILFNGVPSSTYAGARLPMIDPIQLKKMNKEEIMRKIRGNGIDKYFTSLSEVSKPVRNNEGLKQSKYSASLRIDLLRSDLENSGFIRKFGL